MSVFSLGAVVRGMIYGWLAIVGALVGWRASHRSSRLAGNDPAVGTAAWPGASRRLAHVDRVCTGDAGLFKAIIDISQEIIWLKSIDGVYLDCNQAAAAMLGLAREDIVGKTDFELFSPDIAQQHSMTDQQVMASCTPLVEEQNHLMASNGKHLILDMVKSAVRSADGRPTGVLGVARDVTERHRQLVALREQEALLQEMSSLARIGGWELDLVNDIFSWTKELARIHEFAPDQVLTLAMLLDHYHGEDRARLEQALARTTASGAPADLDVELVLPSSHQKWMRAHWRSVVEEGNVTRIWAMVQDMTERHKLDESARIADLIYRTTSDALLVTDEDGLTVDVNPAFVKLLGYSREEAIGMLPWEFRPDGLPMSDIILPSLDTHNHWEGELRMRRRDGEIIDTYVEIDAMRDENNSSFRRVVHLRDITEQNRKDEQIWRHANYDSLTALPNRSLLLDRLEQLIAKAKLEGSCVGVFCIDLDRFAGVNDIHGHAQGDALLVETAERLRAGLPDDVTVGRVGGDRFAALLTGERAQLESHAAAIVNALAAPFDIGGELIHTSASVGIMLYPDDASAVHGLISGAEQAMSLAKRAGGNRFQYFAASLQEAALTKVRLISDLRHALARSQLHMYFQPIVEAQSGRLRKAEALLRWIHPAQGIIGPAQFIPLAEESGLIIQIGDWVVDEAIASVRRWRRELHVDVELSINQSPAQLERSMAQGWIERFSSSGLPRHSITVEITESMLVNDASQMRDTLKLLHQHGAKVSLDDFGTGFSALSYLKLFEVDYLKVDKSFIQNLEQDSNDRALTQAIIDLAHKLGIETIAEGVETTGQRDILKSFGCDYFQGYLYSRPVTREAFEDLLVRQTVS